MLKLKITDGIPKNKREGIIPIGLIFISGEPSICIINLARSITSGLIRIKVKKMLRILYIL